MIPLYNGLTITNEGLFMSIYRNQDVFFSLEMHRVGSNFDLPTLEERHPLENLLKYYIKNQTITTS